MTCGLPSFATYVPYQVADDCGLLPLALGIVGNLAREQPLDPASWQTLHDRLLKGKNAKFRQLDDGKLFSTIDASIFDLPSNQQKQLQLMAVMASGVAVTPEMLAILWDQVCQYKVVGMCHTSAVSPSIILFGVAVSIARCEASGRVCQRALGAYRRRSLDRAPSGLLFHDALPTISCYCGSACGSGQSTMKQVSL